MLVGYNTDILEDRTISAYGKLVYFTLSKFTGKDGACWPSFKTISEIAGVSDRTVQKAIAELVTAQWIIKKKRKSESGDFDSNLYILPRLGVVSEVRNVVNDMNNGCESGSQGVVSDVPANLPILTYPININSCEQMILDYLPTIHGYVFDQKKDFAQAKEWLSKWPADHILSELEKFNSWWRDRSDSYKGKKNFRSSITNWLKRSKVEIKAPIRSPKRLDLS